MLFCSKMESHLHNSMREERFLSPEAEKNEQQKAAELMLQDLGNVVSRLRIRAEEAETTAEKLTDEAIAITGYSTETDWQQRQKIWAEKILPQILPAREQAFKAAEELNQALQKYYRSVEKTDHVPVAPGTYRATIIVPIQHQHITDFTEVTLEHIRHRGENLQDLLQAFRSDVSMTGLHNTPHFFPGLIRIAELDFSIDNAATKETVFTGKCWIDNKGHIAKGT
jgi:hypothetical protein